MNKYTLLFWFKMILKLILSWMPCSLVLYGVRLLLTVHVVVLEANDFIITITLNVKGLDK